MRKECFIHLLSERERLEKKAIHTRFVFSIAKPFFSCFSEHTWTSSLYQCSSISFRLIQHAKYLLTQTEEQICLRIMHALKSMVKTNHEFETRVHDLCLALFAWSSLTIRVNFASFSSFQGQSLRLKLLRRYFSDDKQYLKSLHQPLKGKRRAIRAAMNDNSMIEEDALERLRMTQNELNKQGASDLVVELFMSESPINILEESVNLAIALLEGGNTQVQVSQPIDGSPWLLSSISLSFRRVFSGICKTANRPRKDSSKSSMTKCSTPRKRWRVCHRSHRKSIRITMIWTNRCSYRNKRD